MKTQKNANNQERNHGELFDIMSRILAWNNLDVWQCSVQPHETSTVLIPLAEAFDMPMTSTYFSYFPTSLDLM